MRRVVVTGLGAITPIGNNISEFWDGLKQGVCGIDYITRFDTTDYKVKIAAQVKGFEPLDYMDKGESRRMDLYTQYAMAAAAQAIADSGIMGQVAPERLGTYVGSGVGGMTTFVAEQTKLIEKGADRISPFFVPMMIANMAAGQVAIKYNAQGVNLPVVTACATSSHAIGEAYRAIAYNHADAIIAGGAEAPIVPVSVAGFTSSRALSMRNDVLSGSIPFDLRRDGFVMGEGAGIMILEEYSHAIKRGAKIYAEIKGYANTCDAYHITAPQPEAQGATRAIKMSLKEAEFNIDAHNLYINAHGTSTPLNDKTETMAIKSALGEYAYKVDISSTKSMTGHMLGAAGAAEAIACVLALKESVIPPTINFVEKDPECDLNYTPNKAIIKDVNLAMSLSLGFGGHNASLVFGKVN